MSPQSKGGRAVAGKAPPKRCHRCRQSMAGKSWHGYLGHLGLHGFADRYFCGDMSKAARHLVKNSLAKYDPAPWNGAYPKYKPAQIYRMERTMPTTDFNQIVFDAERHKYFYGDQELISVTRKIKEIEPPFDREAAAQRVAEREGKQPVTVILEWEQKAERGRQLGNAVHEHICKTLIEGKNGLQMPLDPFLLLNTELPEISAFNDLLQKLMAKILWSKEHVEWVVGDHRLGIAGTLDCIFYSLETHHYHLWDWKTGKFDLTNRFANLLPPFDHLENSHFNRYSLQASLYRLIVELNTSLDMGDSYLVHLTPNGAEVHRAIDLREKIVDWLGLAPF